MYSIVETITPARATEYLGKNLPGNRSIRRTWVNDLAFAIRNGDWKLSPTGISFDTNGNLIDGQHRLMAIQKAGIPVECYVTHNAPANAFEVIDRGSGRTAADLAKIGGITATNSTISAVTLLIKQITKRSLGKVDGLVLRFLEENVDTMHRAYTASIRDSHHPIGKIAPVIAACWCAIINGVDIAEIDRFCAVLNSGFAFSDGESAAIVMRNAIMEMGDKRTTYKAEIIFAAVQNAIKCFVEKTPRRKMWTNPAPIYFNGTKAEEIVKNLINE